MANPDYLIVRKNDWYTEALRDPDYDDTMYWCAEQDYIQRDIYDTLAYPIRPMGATDMAHMRRKPHFAEALHILDQFGLLHLMEI